MAPRIVYSTDPDWKPDEERARAAAPEGAPRGEGQTADVALEKRGKGKVVTVVRGVRSHPAGLEALGKRLKSLCGAGGAVKDGAIEVQGDQRGRVSEALEGMGFKVKRRG